MKILPVARNSDIVVQNLNEEVLIYDLITDQAYCLNRTSAIVFNACDGATTFDELKKRHKFNDELIHFALDQLNKENLLAKTAGGYQSVFAGMSRREVIKRIGLTTSAMIALPFISGAAAPSPTQAQSRPACLPDGTFLICPDFFEDCANLSPTCCNGMAVIVSTSVCPRATGCRCQITQ